MTPCQQSLSVHTEGQGRCPSSQLPQRVSGTTMASSSAHNGRETNFCHQTKSGPSLGIDVIRSPQEPRQRLPSLWFPRRKTASPWPPRGAQGRLCSARFSPMSHADHPLLPELTASPMSPFSERGDPVSPGSSFKAKFIVSVGHGLLEQDCERDQS